MRILLVEDDPMVGASLFQALRSVGMSVDWVRDGTEADIAIKSSDYATILLDLGLPGTRGLCVLETMRRRGDKTALIVITARDDTEDRVSALDLGADDYLVKPFHASELLARMRAVLRRQSGHAVSIIGNEHIALNLASHEVTYCGKTRLLPAREFALMLALLQRPGVILSRTQLEERVYGWGEEVESNAIDVLIHSIRRKFDKSIIRNVRGAGWIVGGSNP